jgi:hypothetical protein
MANATIIPTKLTKLLDTIAGITNPTLIMIRVIINITLTAI